MCNNMSNNRRQRLNVNEETEETDDDKVTWEEAITETFGGREIREQKN